MTAWSAEELRRAALEALGSHADERARDALAHGTLTMAAGAARWEASAGPVEAHRVTLTLDARRLGGLRAAPSAVDALCAAIASAITARPAESLLELELRWSRGGRVESSGYRDATPGAPTDALADALGEYLRACGDAAIADALHAQLITAPGDASEVCVDVDRATREAWRADPRVAGAVTRALRDLLADPHLRVRLRSRA